VEDVNQNQVIVDIESPNPRTFVQEILRTYRFLFGQNKGSRKLFSKELKPGICDDGYYDTLLDELCGMSDADLRLRRPELGALIGGRASIFRTSEFPNFGTRLRLVQEHVQKHRPKRLIDLYRDRRDQEKFFTFWAVIIFGTFAIVIGLIQTLLSAAQLSIAYQQWKNPAKE
jgi:hypothetical protein